VSDGPDPASSDPPPKPPVRAVPMDQVRQARGQRKIPVPRSKVAGTRAFRRVKSDRAAGLFGLLLVVLALVLLFTWPQPPQKKEPAYTVEWPTTPVEAFHETIQVGRANPNVERTISFDAANVTRVTLVVQWKDDVGDEDIETDTGNFTLVSPASANLTIALTSRANSTATANATSSRVVSSPPSVREVPARTLAEAKAVLGDHTNRNGTGTWTLRLQLTHIGDDFKDSTARGRLGECPQQSIPQVCTWDPGNALDVRVSYETYQVKLTPAPR